MNGGLQESLALPLVVGHDEVELPAGRLVDLVDGVMVGSRVAIQCDGDRAQTMESVEEERARQQMLRRLGWVFIRVRGSEFFQDRDRAIEKLQRRLQEVEITPAGPATELAPKVKGARDDEEPLHKRVIRRAELIRNRWKDIPTPTSIRKAAAGAEPAPESTD